MLAICFAATGLADAQIPDDADRFKGWSVARVRVEGLPKAFADELLGGLALSGDKKLLGRKRSDFFGSILEQDLDRTRLFLARHGYPDAQVEVGLEPLEAEEELTITLRVIGEPIRVESVSLEGFPESLEFDDTSVLPLAEEIFQDARMNAASAALTDALQQEGYYKAEVELVLDRARSRRVHVVFLAKPGSIYAFRETRVRGAPENLQGLAVRTADLRRGVRYSPRRVRDADENLRILNVFGQIRIDLAPVGTDSLDAMITVTERDPRLFEAGLGYWTEDRLRVSARWQHRNLFKGGRGFEASAIWSQFTARISAGTWWPALVSPRSRLELEAFGSRDTEPNYVQRDLGVTLQNRWYLARRSYWTLGVNLSRVDVSSDVADSLEIPEAQGLVTTIGGGLDLDNTNDPVLPTRGRFFRLRFDLSPDLVSVSPYTLAEANVVQFRTLKGQTFVSGRMRLGLASPISGNTEILPNRRFYSGGSTTHRGFGRRKLGPVDINGDPLGGEAVLELSLDLRFPIWGLLRGAVFMDVGQVWGTVEETRLDEMEVAVGPGIWIKTPVGPVRLDYGHRLTTRSPEPRNAWHLTFGTTF